MVDIREKRSFQAFWKTWRDHLNLLVTARGAKLLCPSADELVFTETATGYIAKPERPIGLIALPQKGTSGSEGHKLVAFIDGTFSFSYQPQVPLPQGSLLVSADSHVAFFKATAGEQRSTLNLIDAYHFDHFNVNPKESSPHPVFHAQRNIRSDDCFPLFLSCLDSDPHNNMEIGQMEQHEKNELFRLKTFRLPTPQIDLFSLSAIIAADHLVDKCSHDSTAYGSFKSFLKHISLKNTAITSVQHQHNVKADAAVAANRYVWQWYSTH